MEILSAKEFERLKGKETLQTTTPPADGTYEWTNPHTGEIMDIPKGVDPGWNYDIAGTAWGKNMSLAEMEKFDGGKWSDVDPWPYSAYKRPGKIPVDIPVAAAGQIAKNETQLRKALKDAIGGDEAFFTNPFGEKVVVNQALVDHMLKNKKRWDGREAYFPFIPELIKSPYEIWINFAKNEATGQYGIREKYIKAIRLDKSRSLVFIAEASGGKWTGFTFFRGDVQDINNVRKGRLLWGR